MYAEQAFHIQLLCMKCDFLTMAPNKPNQNLIDFQAIEYPVNLRGLTVKLTVNFGG